MTKQFLFSTLFTLLFIPSVYACPLCKDAVEKMGEVWTSLGFNWSIYFMLAVPYVLVGGFVLVLYLKHRQRQL